MPIFSEAQLFGMTIRESADDGSDFTNPAADYRRLFLGEDGQLHVKDSAGTVTAIGGTLGAWTSYTPSWTATTTNPVLGSSTIVGRYKLLDSKTLVFQINLSITTGGAFSDGSGNYIFSLPAGMTSHASRIQVVTCHLLDNGTTHFIAIGKVAGGATTIAETVVADATNPRILNGDGSPFTLANGDQINYNGLIEIQ